MNEHRHVDEAELLQGVLERSRAECGECTARAGELGDAVGRMRELLAHESEVDARRDTALAERVLALTTRSQVGARGAVRRLTRRTTWSPVWRWVAAVLLIQLAALPVVAWVALRKPAKEQRFDTRLESPRGPSLPEPSEPERSPRFSEREPRVGSVEHDAAAVDAAVAQIARERERESLKSAGLPVFDGAMDELDSIARLLVLRQRVLSGRLAAGELVSAAPKDDEPALEQALWCEAALDLWVLGGEREPALELRLRSLARSQASAEQPLELARVTLERAERCGALDAQAHAWLAQLQRARPASNDASVAAPLDRTWREALRSALSERARAGDATPSAASERVRASWLAID